MLQQYQRIMVAVDGSNEAELAFQKAINIANRNNASLLLVHVIDTRAFQDVNSFGSMLAEQASDLAKQSLSEYSERAQNEGVKAVETAIEYGSPKVIIAKQIPEDKNVDLIILGATGLNAVERLFIGSVSEYVTRNALCDVLIVRTDAENNLPEVEEN
ncbi:universal stress family protein [Tetragenococcus muriaticus PMC-11-5]|uniref:Universal stress protein n=1 Tax=Tetragenococcus muriaticus PMC-11-5 TaxID=1302649 RepID=A0A091BWL0_9ENTE|nr:universal stress protein [Tetragenococcus muriaticus]KFN90006.1 universal stress family protein [Tetragenococcus muriaticus PMC-11-5]GMA47861.1 universal stress protein [Tetragenococcus muriaticus]